MKRNFNQDKKKKTMKTKGIAIQINTSLLEKIEQQKIPHNDFIIQALNHYLEVKSNHSSNDDEIPIEIYEEIYSTLHNTEISPLKKKLDHANQTISIYQDQINELKHDKLFLMDHCNNLIKTFQKQKKSSFWHRRKNTNDETNSK